MRPTPNVTLRAKHGATLRCRAAKKRSESAVVRDLIDRELQRGFDFGRVRRLVGSSASPPKHWEKDAWRKYIRQATGVDPLD